MHMPCMAASRAAGICDKKHKGPSLVGLPSKASKLKFYKLLTSLDATAASASEGTSRGGMRLRRVRLGSGAACSAEALLHDQALCAASFAECMRSRVALSMHNCESVRHVGSLSLVVQHM